MMCTKKIIRLVALVWMFFITTTQATVYYVDVSIGNDTYEGSEDYPWKTVQKAASTLIAGDTVFIKAGTYTPTQKIEMQNSGTKDNYISYLAYPGDEHLVIIDGDGVSLPNWYGIFVVMKKKYIKISGLKVVNSSYAGFFIDESSNVIIENNYTEETHSSGISVWNSNLVVVDNCIVTRACWPTGGEQECISIVTSNQVLVENNQIFDGGSIGYGGGGEGIDFKDGCTNGVVINNTVHDIASVGIYVDAYKTNQSNIYVSRNIVYNIAGVGVSIASEEGGSLKNVIVSKNVIHDCEDRGVVIHWTAKPDYLIENIYVYHNTIYKNGEGLDVGAHISSGNINIVNNIFSQNRVYQMQNSSNDFDVNQLHITNNLLDGDNPSWALSGDNSILEKPVFVDVFTNDFRLQDTSPGINQGAFLTKTVGAGTGTIVTLEDVGFFTNGFGVTVGDLINIKDQNKQFEIVDVDYVNNVITLDKTTSWDDGTGVSLVCIDNMPDVGVYEYDSWLGVSPYMIDEENSTIYPNPIKNSLHISDKGIRGYYQIISTNGRVVQKGELIHDVINVANVNNGVYFFKVINTKSYYTVVLKFVKE